MPNLSADIARESINIQKTFHILMPSLIRTSNERRNYLFDKSIWKSIVTSNQEFAAKTLHYYLKPAANRSTFLNRTRLHPDVKNIIKKYYSKYFKKRYRRKKGHTFRRKKRYQ